MQIRRRFPREMAFYLIFLPHCGGMETHTNMKAIGRLIVSALVAALLLSLTSCGKAPTEDEAKKIAEELIKASCELNAIYFGEGMPHSEPAATSIYADVTDDAPYLTEDELRAATSAVFTENYAESIFSVYLGGYSDEDTGDVIFPRYVENGDRLTINLNIEPLVEKERTYDFSTAVLKKCRSKLIVIEYTTLIDGKEDCKVEVTLRLVNVTKDGEKVKEWRVDSPTY